LALSTPSTELRGIFLICLRFCSVTTFIFVMMVNGHKTQNDFRFRARELPGTVLFSNDFCAFKLSFLSCWGSMVTKRPEMTFVSVRHACASTNCTVRAVHLCTVASHSVLRTDVNTSQVLFLRQSLFPHLFLYEYLSATSDSRHPSKEERLTTTIGNKT
jgi:hypothetical protein